MMHSLLWLVLAWVSGTAAIFGSLMTIASLLLWLIPASPAKSRRTDSPHPWIKRLQLTIVAIAIALTGLTILIFVPFPGK